MRQKVPETYEEKVEQLDELRASAHHDEAAIEKQHAKGKLTARERLDLLIDQGSFQEVGLFAEHRGTYFGMAGKELPADGVVTGSAVTTIKNWAQAGAAELWAPDISYRWLGTGSGPSFNFGSGAANPDWLVTGQVASMIAQYGVDARRVYIAGMLRNTPDTLVAWLRDPQRIVERETDRCARSAGGRNLLRLHATRTETTDREHGEHQEPGEADGHVQAQREEHVEAHERPERKGLRGSEECQAGQGGAQRDEVGDRGLRRDGHCRRQRQPAQSARSRL